MSLQINRLTLKQLIDSFDQDDVILKKHYQGLVNSGHITEAYMYAKLARRKATRKVLVEVKRQKKTNIKVEQIKLF